jgi:membrane-associated phospholipid phosphatase
MIRKILSFFRKLMVFIFMTPFLKKIRRKHPKLYHFLIKRFSLRRFSGMPLTLLVIAIAANIIMMLDVYEDILNAKAFIDIDNTVARFLYRSRTDSIADFFYVFTQLGNEYVILCAIVLMSVLFIVRKKTYNIAGLAVSVLGSALTVQLGKHIFKISRPVEYSYYHMDSYSFPSGHSTAAVAFY